MKKLIFRKFNQDICGFFLIMCLSIGLIVWTLQAVNYLDYVIEDGHGLKTYLLYSIFNFPKIVNRLIPFILFITLVFIITNYDAKNELIIFWTNGISKNEFVNNIIIISFILTLIQIFISSYISPYAQLKGRQQLKESNIDYFPSLIKNGKFINIVDGLTIFINSKNINGNFENIFIDDSSKNNKKIIYAKNGFIENNPNKKTFKLFNGQIINKSQNQINAFKFDQIDFNLTDFSSTTILVPKIQEYSSLSLLKCFEPKLKKYIFDNLNKFKCEESMKKDIKQELFKRFYKPLYIPIISVLSCFLIVLSKNNVGYKKNRFIIILLCFSFLVLSEGSLRYSTLSDFTTYVYLFLPIISFIFIYYLLKKRLKYV